MVVAALRRKMALQLRLRGLLDDVVVERADAAADPDAHLVAVLEVDRWAFHEADALGGTWK